MAKKIDLKSLDWASILIEAAIKTHRSYEKSRGNGRLGPDLREVIRAYEDEGDDLEDDDPEDDDLEDEDPEDNDLNPNSENSSTSKRSATDQEDSAELACLREQVVILRERLAASEERLALSESARRESSEREAQFVTRERELIGLIGEALRGGALARVTSSRDTTQPATPPVRGDNPAPPHGIGENLTTTPARDQNPATTPARDQNPATPPARDQNLTTTPVRDNSPATTPARDQNPATPPARGENPATTGDNPATAPARGDNPVMPPARDENPATAPARGDNPATPPARGYNPAPPHGIGENLTTSAARDDNPATTIPPRPHISEERAESESDADIAQEAEVDGEIEVDLAGAGSPAFDSSKIIDVELVIPDEPAKCAQIEEDDIGEESAPVAQVADEARGDVIAPATDEESDQPPDLAAAGQSSHHEDARPNQTHAPESRLLPADPLGRADAALGRGEYVEARKLFEALEAKGCELGPEGELVLVTIRRGLAESCLGVRDFQRALRVSKQALSAASSNLKAAPTAVNLFNYLSSARVRGMVLLATGDPLPAQTLLQRACVRADRCGIDFSQAHENELGVMVRLIEGIESSKQLKGARKPERGRKSGRGRKTGRGRGRKGRGRR